MALTAANRAQRRQRLSIAALAVLASAASASISALCWLSPGALGSWQPAASRGVAQSLGRGSAVVRHASQAQIPGDMKTGLRIIVDGVPMIVESFLSKRQGKGIGITKTKMKNLLTGANVEETLSSGSKYDLVETEWKSGTYSYFNQDDQAFVLMDSESFEEFTVSAAVMGEQGEWMSEGSQVEIEYWNGRVINLQVTGDIIMEVKEIVMKKDNGRDAQVMLSNGLTKAGPAYLEVGDKVLIDKKNFNIVKRL